MKKVVIIFAGLLLLSGCNFSNDIWDEISESRDPVVSVYPAAGELQAADNTTVIITFSLEMNTDSITAKSVRLQDHNGNNIPLYYSWSDGDKTVTMYPVSYDSGIYLVHGEIYSIILSEDIEDAYENRLDESRVYRFTVL